MYSKKILKDLAKVLSNEKANVNYYKDLIKNDIEVKNLLDKIYNSVLNTAEDYKDYLLKLKSIIEILIE